MVEPEFIFELAIVELDAPTPLGEPDEAPESERLAPQVGQPELGRRGLVLRPFHEQLDRLGGNRASHRPAVREPDREPRKARPEWPFASRAPRHRMPRGLGQRLREGA